MTDEQIKQNAEVYAITHKYTLDELNNSILTVDEIVRLAHIAGARSMLEEIEELKKQLAAMTRLKNSFAGGVDILDNDNKELQEELEQLRNPWISVKKRLPEEGSDNISIQVAAITNKGYWFKGQFDFNNKDWFFSEDPDHLDFEEDEFVTHWMPIPKLKK